MHNTHTPTHIRHRLGCSTRPSCPAGVCVAVPFQCSVPFMPGQASARLFSPVCSSISQWVAGAVHVTASEVPTFRLPDIFRACHRPQVGHGNHSNDDSCAYCAAAAASGRWPRCYPHRLLSPFYRRTCAVSAHLTPLTDLQHFLFLFFVFTKTITAPFTHCLNDFSSLPLTSWCPLPPPHWEPLTQCE